MENIEIKRVSPTDVELLQAIGKKTFIDTFAESNTEEDMAKYLNEGFAINKLLFELNNKDSEFYFATFDNEVIGYLKLNFGQAQTELRDNKALEIERFYISKAFHGKKVSQLLYNRAIQIAHKEKLEYVWLGVWENNLRAISFYKKNGFIEFDKHVFRLGDDEQIDIMMRLRL